MKKEKIDLLKKLIHLENQIKKAEGDSPNFTLWRRNFNPKQQEIFADFCRVFDELYGGFFGGHFSQTSQMQYTCDKSDYESKFVCAVCKEQTNILQSHDDCEHCNSPLEHFHSFWGGRVTRVRLNELKDRLNKRGCAV